MPIPFLVGAAAVAGVTLTGAVKGIDIASKNSDSKTIVDRSITRYKQTLESLDIQREEAKKKLENLGYLKTDIFANDMNDFISSVSNICNIDITDDILKQRGYKDNPNDIVDIEYVKNVTLKAGTLAIDGITSSGNDVLVNLAINGCEPLLLNDEISLVQSIKKDTKKYIEIQWLERGNKYISNTKRECIIESVDLKKTFLYANVLESLDKGGKEYNRVEVEEVFENLNKITIFVKSLEVMADAYLEFIHSFSQIYSSVVCNLSKIIQTAIYVQAIDIRYDKIDYNKLTKRQQSTVDASWIMSQTMFYVLTQPFVNNEGRLNKEINMSIDKAKELFTVAENMMNELNHIPINIH